MEQAENIRHKAQHPDKHGPKVEFMPKSLLFQDLISQAELLIQWQGGDRADTQHS